MYKVWITDINRSKWDHHPEPTQWLRFLRFIFNMFKLIWNWKYPILPVHWFSLPSFTLFSLLIWYDLTLSSISSQALKCFICTSDNVIICIKCVLDTFSMFRTIHQVQLQTLTRLLSILLRNSNWFWGKSFFFCHKGYSCHRLSAILKGKLKSFSTFSVDGLDKLSH